ncbi:hypothetical protein N781_09720 [Pontibacillus halophilus JSM 076056 = DSM 19796]|uniref:N-acetyltransferase domain-containing protein n=1 Tax=Pontibacillus halophilus JSM 076056 = DSM 19796 TaxID=1385510 RepID=A0A0A5HYH3_9BACI|nr:GNAT family N-acetyltransferase [Pontibacillus halophilus]KGX88667.1 hypothetical protein N781_09720 [Pontibacillus halophilus JSM 076056 = DSM 19796]
MKIYQAKDEDIRLTMLDSFQRYQKTERVYVECNGEILEKYDRFEDTWSISRKREVVRHFSEVIANGGLILLVERNHQIIGFAVIEGVEFGETAVYRELSYIHIDRRHRGKGIGKALFEMVRKAAKDIGAAKLYIGAHPSVETQHFYTRMGCTLAKEINQAIYEREPRDLRLEISVYS